MVSSDATGQLRRVELSSDRARSPWLGRSFSAASQGRMHNRRRIRTWLKRRLQFRVGGVDAGRAFESSYAHKRIPFRGAKGDHTLIPTRIACVARRLRRDNQRSRRESHGQRRVSSQRSWRPAKCRLLQGHRWPWPVHFTAFGGFAEFRWGRGRRHRRRLAGLGINAGGWSRRRFVAATRRDDQKGC
jgi:hypothetical protein